MPSPRFRCTGCGNLTRFDVIATRRTREFHHFTVGGDLSIDESEVVEEQFESVICRWCGASGQSIDEVGQEESVEGGELRAGVE